MAKGGAVLQMQLRSARVLLVLDDIWTSHQLHALLWPVGDGSRVLVTSRAADVLLGIPLQHIDILSQPAAMELFLRHGLQPTPDCSYIAAEIVKICGGLPLSLTAVGDILRLQQDRRQWEKALQQLQAAEVSTTVSDRSIIGTLRVSYDALGSNEHADVPGHSVLHAWQAS